MAHLLPQISPVFSSLPSHEKAGPIVADPLGRAAPRRSDCLPKASVCEGFEGDSATAINLFLGSWENSVGFPGGSCYKS